MLIRLSAIALATIAIYYSWLASSLAQYHWIVWAITAFIAASGLFFQRRWAQYVVYTLALVQVASLLVVTFRVAMTGWPYPDALSTLISLVPGMLWLIFWIAICLSVYRHYRRPDIAS